MRPRAILAIVAAAALTAASAFAEPPTQELILEVRVGRAVLVEAVLAYERDGRVYLPLTEIADALEFPIQLDADRGHAHGWYLKEGRTYAIDTVRAEVVREGETTSVSPDAFIVGDFLGLGELYVATDTLELAWPLRILVDMSRLSVIVDPDEPLPVQRRAERRLRRELAFARHAHGERAPRFGNGYRMLTAPVIDAESSVRFEDNRAGSRHSVTGTNDVVGFNAHWFASAEHDGNSVEASDLRLTLRRSVAAAPLPAGLRDIQAGDVRLPNLRLIEDSQHGRGVVFSSFPVHEADAFDRTTIDGDGIPGWEVELYRNNELLAFDSVDGDGRYRFEDVPLIFGVNRLRVVLYGPQGQVRELVEQVVVGEQMAPHGQTRFRVGALQAGHDLFPVGDEPHEADGMLVNAEFGYGVTRRISVFSRYNRVPTDHGQRSYLMSGVAGTVLGGYAQLELNADLDGGIAGDLQFATSFGRTSLSTGLSYLHGFESPIAGFGEGRMQFRGRARLDTLVPTSVGPLSLSLSTTSEERRSGFSRTTIEARQSLALRPLRVTHTTDTVFQDGEDRSGGDLSLSTGTGRLRLRAGVDYDIAPDAEIVNARSTVTRSFSQNWIASFDVVHEMESSTTSLGSVVTRDFGVMLVGLDGKWSTDDRFSVGLRLALSVGPGSDDGYDVRAAPRTTTGAVRARVFLDRDRDGNFGPDDEPLRGVRLAIGPRRSARITDDAGRILITDLPSLTEQTVSVDLASLEDPYWVPGNRGYALVARPGVVPELTLPVVETGAIDGFVRLAGSERPVAGVRLELIAEQGGVRGRSVSSYDGFYVFEHVPPGRYSIRAQAKGKLEISTATVDVAADDPFLTDVILGARVGGGEAL